MFEKFNQILKNKLNDNYQFIQKGESFDITIIDDVFPYIKSPWRNSEFIEIAKYYKLKVYCDVPQNNKYIPDKLSFSEMSKQFNLLYPNHNIDYTELKLFSPLNTKLVYLQFYNYLSRYYKHIKKNECKYVLKIYPGGGFEINNSKKDAFLKEVSANPNCRGIAVNLKSIYNYLLNNNLVAENKLTLLLGGIQDIDFNKLTLLTNEKKYFKLNKETFDIAFAANKYFPLGVDKGFDIFIETAKILVQKYPFMKFHVVGHFNPNDLPYKELLKYFTFYGFRESSFFYSFYQNIDVFISPNRQFIENPGQIDGFPLGTSLEPAINKVVLLLTDYLNDNSFLKDKEDYFCINDGILKIINVIDQLIENPLLLIQVGNNGKLKYLEFLNYKINVQKHLEFFNKALL